MTPVQRVVTPVLCVVTPVLCVVNQESSAFFCDTSALCCDTSAVFCDSSAVCCDSSAVCCAAPHTVMTDSEVTTVLEPRLGWLQSWLPWLRWTPTSPLEVERAEERLLAYCSTKSTGFYVQAGRVNGVECR